MYNKGQIFNIQRFSSSDGPGIRTVVFLKGCPLNCTWCHNPESKSMKTEIFYMKELCIGCGACVKACGKKNHFFENNSHVFKRDDCCGCGECVKACPSNALKLCGKEENANEVIKEVLKDKPFYDESGGGLTLSGGEPLMQYDFSLSLLKLAKEHNVHTAIETCGFSDKDFSEINQYTDLWLYDVKLFSAENHIKYTGVSNEKILENLFFLDKIGAKIILRCPIIPKVNLSENHFGEIAKLSNKLKNVEAIHLEPYHPLGISKSEQLCKNQAYKNNSFLEKSLLEPFYQKLQENTNKAVIIT